MRWKFILGKIKVPQVQFDAKSI